MIFRAAPLMLYAILFVLPVLQAADVDTFDPSISRHIKTISTLCTQQRDNQLYKMELKYPHGFLVDKYKNRNECIKKCITSSKAERDRQRGKAAVVGKDEHPPLDDPDGKIKELCASMCDKRFPKPEQSVARNKCLTKCIDTHKRWREEAQLERKKVNVKEEGDESQQRKKLKTEEKRR